MSKFRKDNPRIDYYPAPDAAAAIERFRLHHPNVPTRALVDVLVVAGFKALAPTKKVTPTCPSSRIITLACACVERLKY
jgi:hypothetical protein